MLPAKLTSPPTVEAGMNPGIVRTGLRGDCGKVVHTPAAHGGRTRDIWGSLCHSSVYISRLHVCCFPHILCVLPDSWAHYFLFLTPKNAILTKLYLKALSFPLGPISEAWHPNKQPPSVPRHLAPSSQNAPLIPPSPWKSFHSTFADSAWSVIPAAIFKSSLPFHACCQNVACALVNSSQHNGSLPAWPVLCILSLLSSTPCLS